MSWIGFVTSPHYPADPLTPIPFRLELGSAPPTMKMTTIVKTFLSLLVASSEAIPQTSLKPTQNQTSALVLVGKAFKEAETIEYELDRLRSLKFIARTQARAGDLPAAMKTIERIQKEATSERSRKLCLPGAYSGIAFAQARAGDLKAAFDTVEKGGTDVLEIVSAQAETTGIADAMKTVDLKIDRKIRDFALQNISRSRAKIGDFKGAIQVADMIQSTSIKEDTYGSISAVQALNGDSSSSQRSLARIANPSTREAFEKVIKDGPLTETKVAILPTAFERCDGYLNIACFLLDTDNKQ